MDSLWNNFNTLTANYEITRNTFLSTQNNIFAFW